jgi:ATP/maltotriose-dependent transcriptional regulator MalT
VLLWGWLFVWIAVRAWTRLRELHRAVVATGRAVVTSHMLATFLRLQLPRALFFVSGFEENAPAQVVAGEAGAHLDAITNLLTTTDDAQLRTRLIEQAGTAAALTGWLAFDRGSRETARRYYAVAERAAGQAGHSPLAACIRTYHSYLAEAEGNPAEAARYLQESLDTLPRGRQPVMWAWLNARQGEEFAALGDRDNELRAFDRAYMAHDLGSAASEQPMWTRFFTATRLDGMAVAAYARLDHHDMEASAARLLGEVGDCRTKVEQIALANLAYAYLERGDVDRGAELAQRALTAINKSRTRVGYDRLAVVARALAPYGSSRTVAGLRNNLRPRFGCSSTAETS